ncbi:tol-pal system protein YbgF [Paraneptunicella aestuarii]|uniref:tol-pal system protein YbgF n=1 Tax=Paraneptunicella aestuarii TaxID=2831148 RepID=UPI001E5C1325|nr:tol-pal system protein YbgF [Paraneptunicella aestuarii]UAA37318.1 tol-pal system protein YbgF [Paraneptunicella aestuarii]
MSRLNKKALLPFLVYGAAVNAAPAPVESVNGGSVNDRVAVLERMVEARSVAQHRIQGQLDEMQQEVNEIRGELELHSYKLEQILQRQRELYLEIDKRIQAAMKTPVASVQESVVSTEPELSADENELYDRAVNLILKDKLYDKAIPEFQSFLKRFPNSGYVPNAHYWLGLLLFNKQEWKNAEQHFNQVVSFYPDSPKRADSMLKLGIIAQHQNNQAKAMQLYEQVISEYPDSSVRKLADARIRSLKQGG